MRFKVQKNGMGMLRVFDTLKRHQIHAWAYGGFADPPKEEAELAAFKLAAELNDDEQFNLFSL